MPRQRDAEMKLPGAAELPVESQRKRAGHRVPREESLPPLLLEECLRNAGLPARG